MDEIANALTTLQLIQEVYADECERFEELLYPYALLVHQGLAPTALYTDLVDHLNDCEQCIETYESLLALFVAQATDEWVQPAAIPNSAAEQTPARSLAQAVKAWLMHKEGEIAEVVVNLGYMSPLSSQLQLRHQPNPVDNQPQASELVMTIPEEASHVGLDVRCSFTLESAESNQGLLLVEVSIPSRWPDFAGTIITLEQRGERVETQVTNTGGIVRFIAISRAPLSVSKIRIRLVANIS